MVIIGESVRKDYMSAYGFKYSNTPFTDNNASLIWDGLIAPASNTQSSIPQLIVMHLIGSHPHFGKRLQFDVQFDLNNKNVSCYISSIKETDDLLKSTVEILKKHNEDYSLVYFADHGLSHTEQYQDLRHNWEYQNSFQVPLIFFDSDKTNQVKINKQISGYQFVYLLSHWMGIQLNVQHDYMQYDLTDIPEQKNIQIKDWQNKLYPFNNLKKDPNPF